MDIGGGRITVVDIDRMKEYPQADVVTVSGLRQDTFEYFINTYGKQLKAIRFFKNKFIEDLSPLGALPQLEYVSFFANQRAERLWDMSGNTSMTGLCIEDFSRLSSIDGIETAPALKEFRIGNAIWCKMVIESFKPLAGTAIERLAFYGRAIADNDLSFIEDLPCLKRFDFSLNMFTTEQIAWIVANFPNVEGFALKAKEEWMLDEVPKVIIVGKRKPNLTIAGNEQKIQKYVDNFESLKIKYKGMSYKEAFPS